MREIKFKGYCKFYNYDIDTPRSEWGKWVYGALVKNSEDDYLIITEEGPTHIVEPESIGQYIGLKDTDGKEIYEGDIIEVTHKFHCCGDQVEKFVGKVVWMNYGFNIEILKWIQKTAYSYYNVAEFRSGDEIVILGNSFENSIKESENE